MIEGKEVTKEGHQALASEEIKKNKKAGKGTGEGSRKKE